MLLGGRFFWSGIVDLCYGLEVDLFVEWVTGDERNLFADEFGNLVQVFYFFWFTKHDCVTLETCSSGSPDTMDVYFWFERNVVDDDVRKFVDIDSSGCDVGSDKNTDRTVL